MLKALLIAISCLLILPIQAQSQDQSTQQLSAVVTVITEGVYVQRGGTAREFPLSEGSIFPLGINDHIRTDDNGRIFISFFDDNQLYMLPESTFVLHEFSTQSDETITLTGELNGIAIGQFIDNSALGAFNLITDGLTVTQPSALFAVWAVDDSQLQAAISAEGDLGVEKSDQGDVLNIPSESGILTYFDIDAVMLNPPFHPAQLLVRGIDCMGIVATGSNEGLRLRSGAALDYSVVDVFQERQEVSIVGTTENGLWYRVPFLTGFAWSFSNLIIADCEGLPRLPNLVRERNESIEEITDAELTLLTPFYGLPNDNPIFYQ